MNIQSELKAPKNNFNSFGNYKYRSCEDIVEALKPILKQQKATLIISDTIELIGDRFYLKATATLMDIENGGQLSASAYAREEESKKGMDASQLTGSVSSYARKYALNGLFCIDDTKDSDSLNKHDTETTESPKSSPRQTQNQGISEAQVKRLCAIAKGKKISVETVKRKVLEEYKKTNISDLSKTEYDELVNRIEKVGA